MGLVGPHRSAQDMDIRLVRGCPCYKEFGNECVCLNDDDVRPVRVIELNPSLLGDVRDPADLQDLRSDREDMCYLLTFLDDDRNILYCISMGRPVSIDSKNVRASDVRTALTFVTTGQTQDGRVCSACLYRYLVTLGSAIDGLLTESERVGLIEEYVRRLMVRTAAWLGQGSEDIGDDDDAFCTSIREHIEALGRMSTEWVSRIVRARIEGAHEEVIRLYGCYRRLCRLESVFLNQVLALRTQDNRRGAIETMRFMAGLTDRVLELNREIDTIADSLTRKGLLTPDSTDEIMEHEQRRRAAADRFANIGLLLGEIVNRPT